MVTPSIDALGVITGNATDSMGCTGIIGGMPGGLHGTGAVEAPGAFVANDSAAMLPGVPFRGGTVAYDCTDSSGA